MESLNILIFRDNGWWSAQCLEYDFGAQARTLEDVQAELIRVIEVRIAMGKKLGVDPFDLPPAPEAFRKIIDREESIAGFIGPTGKNSR